MNAMTKKQRKQNTAKRNEELNATNQMVVTPAHYEELEELQLESVAGGGWPIEALKVVRPVGGWPFEKRWDDLPGQFPKWKRWDLGWDWRTDFGTLSTPSTGILNENTHI